MGGFVERPRQSIILFSETRLFHVPEGAGEIPDKMIQPALADSIPTLIELVSTHAWAAGIEYRRDLTDTPLSSPSRQTEGRK
jgi:hypothetical protein